MTISYTPMGRATLAIPLLPNHERDKVHLLHPNKAAQHAAEPDQHLDSENEALGAGGADGVVFLQVNRDFMVARIFASLMQACTATGNMEVMTGLAQVPAAQEFRTPALVALLQAVSKSPAAPSVKTTVVTLLASLPWAQEIRAEQAPSVQSLLQLPGAKQVDAGFVLELLVKAVHAELPQVTTQLGRFVATLDPDRALVQSALKAIASSPCCQGAVQQPHHRRGRVW